MAETVQATHQATAETFASQQSVASSTNGATVNGHSTQMTIVDTATEEESHTLTVEVPSSETIDSLVPSLVESAATAREPEPEQLTLQPRGAASSLDENTEPPASVAQSETEASESPAAVEPAPEAVALRANVESAQDLTTASAATAVDIEHASPDVTEASALAGETPEGPAPHEAESVSELSAVAAQTTEPVSRTASQSSALAVESLEASPDVQETASENTASEAEPIAPPTSEQSVPAVETLAPPVAETPASAAAIEQLASELIAEPAASSTIEPLVEFPLAESLADAPVIAAPIQPQIEPQAAAVDEAIEQLAAEQLVAIETTPAPAPIETLQPDTAIEDQLPHALALHAEAILETITEQLQVRESGIREIVTSFQVAPAIALLTPPAEVLSAPAAPTKQWKRTPRPTIPAMKPIYPADAVQMFGPQPLTLAGPSLPVQLRTFTEDRSTRKLHGSKRASLPSWVVSLVVATCLFLGAGSVMQFFTGSREPRAAAAQTNPQAATPVPAPVVEPHPFSRFIEVTGIRVVADLSRKSQVQYIVVNHSSIAINNASIRLAVRSAAESSGAPALFTVSAVVSLGPYQSKEIRTDLDSQLRSTAIPEWDNLRPDVQVSIEQ